MVVPEMTRLLEKRRTELIYLLENKADELDLEKQHQIYGAINEIEIFLQTLDYYRNKEINDELEDIKLVRPSEKRGIFSVFKERLFRNR